MPLVINSCNGWDTRTHVSTYTPTSLTKAISRNQVCKGKGYTRYPVAIATCIMRPK